MRLAASKRWVISGATGSQPHLKLRTTAGIDGKLPSTIRPATSGDSAASRTAMAPPREWPNK